MVFLAFPLVFLCRRRLQDPAASCLARPDVPPEGLEWANFTDAIDKTRLWTTARNSAVVATVTMLVTIVLAAGGLRPRPLPHQAARRGDRVDPAQPGLPVHPHHHPAVHRPGDLQSWSELIDTLVGLIAVYTVWSLPFACGCCTATSPASPSTSRRRERWTAPRGCSVLRTIVLPLLAPGLVATALFTFISSWNEFFFALVLIQSPERETLPLTLASFVGAEGQVQLGQLAAASLLATIPSLVFFALIQRRLTSGLLSGAVKG